MAVCVFAKMKYSTAGPYLGRTDCLISKSDMDVCHDALLSLF